MNDSPEERTQPSIRLDHRLIMDLIPEGSTVLDLGCGDGKLLHLLAVRKKVKGSGIELNEAAVRQCADFGLSVSQQDIDCGLSDYADKSFDFVVMNQSLQQAVRLEFVLQETLRVGRHSIIVFPNFAYYKARLQMFFSGRTPVTPSLPNMWYDTPNVHFLSISDFIRYCRNKEIKIDRAVFAGNRGKVVLFPNLFSQVGIFLLSDG